MKPRLLAWMYQKLKFFKKNIMEHFFNCHGEWGVILASLSVIGTAWYYTKNSLVRFWRFILLYCRLMWLSKWSGYIKSTKNNSLPSSMIAEDVTTFPQSNTSITFDGQPRTK